ncbi:hypothetical protein GQ42DRAFT_49901 [Ramicandelaber brevisporus]|nr:hypothetical protein GQ42DRAFT_49901 [Ramicandelaber brevisporus]
MTDLGHPDDCVYTLAALISSHLSTLTTIEILPVDPGAVSAPVIADEGRVLGLPVSLMKTSYPGAHVAPYFENAKSYDDEQLQALTMYAVVFNSELTMAWNRRKALLQRSVIQPEFELKLCNLLLSTRRHAKSSCLWAHRRFVINHWRSQQQSKDVSELSKWIMSVIRAELDVCARVASIYPRNYLAWTHRSCMMDESWLITDLLSSDRADLLDDESRFTRDWIARHPFDHSALSYRIVILRRFHNGHDWVKEIEETVQPALSLYVDVPNDALWSYLRLCYVASRGSRCENEVLNAVQQTVDLWIDRSDSDPIWPLASASTKEQTRLLARSLRDSIEGSNSGPSH